MKNRTVCGVLNVAWIVGALMLALAAILALSSPDYRILPFSAPSLCSGHACEAIGALVVLPNADRVDVEVWGPGPGVWWAPAGSPSNVGG